MSPIQRLSLDSGTFPLLRLIGRHGVLKRKAALSIRQAEWARLKYPERERGAIGVGVIRIKK